MLELTINGLPQSLADPITLDQALQQWQPATPVAVAVNGEFVPRSQYASTELKMGDSVELLAPVAGG